ncbi:helix-turn-helix domain-containing protein [Cryobacterium sp. TMT4-31]|uniref:helix-turn-helix domain-containing protein n=1 Tax=Cryobacterium sp. TMT4-31 TaxID=1259259 RepID=UPI00106AC9E0|nr:helix-turn-helix domain-containing protein [Cryobacterium sp. TMT4-31]TFC84858.1 helix-turn-helix domain-containing protein [Cryobacterium sp. TMT4-31]
MIREASGYIAGENGLVVLIPPRAAVMLLRSGALDAILSRYPTDTEVFNSISALRHVATLYSSAPGTALGTTFGAMPEPERTLIYLSTTEAAERARVTDRGIRKAISRGTLKAERVGNRWQISTEELQQYITNR